jgi:hypothetical protein
MMPSLMRVLANNGARRRAAGYALVLRRAAVFVVTVSAFALAPFSARAQAEDQAAARTLFNGGRELLKARQYADACPKFEAARKLYASAGILLNLGDCYEHLGRTASAWTEFGEALAVAQRTGRLTEASEAAKRQAALEPTLSLLTVRVARPTPGLVISRGGAELASAAWGAAIPLDPGRHELKASAPGYEPWSKSVTISASERISIDVPELKARPTEALMRGNGAAILDREPAPPSKERSTTLEWALIGGGAVLGLAGGALMIVESIRAQNAADGETWDSAKALWIVGLAGAAVGGISVGVGVALLSTSPETTPASASIAPRTPLLEFSGTW